MQVSPSGQTSSLLHVGSQVILVTKPPGKSRKRHCSPLPQSSSDSHTCRGSHTRELDGQMWSARHSSSLAHSICSHVVRDLLASAPNPKRHSSSGDVQSSSEAHVKARPQRAPPRIPPPSQMLPEGHSSSVAHLSLKSGKAQLASGNVDSRTSTRLGTGSHGTWKIIRRF